LPSQIMHCADIPAIFSDHFSHSTFTLKPLHAVMLPVGTL